jgi:hypothetical protein
MATSRDFRTETSTLTSCGMSVGSALTRRFDRLCSRVPPVSSTAGASPVKTRDLDLHLLLEVDQEVVDVDRVPGQRVALNALDQATRRAALTGEAELHHARAARAAVEGLERLDVDLDRGRVVALAVHDARNDPGAAQPLVRLAVRLARVERELQVHWW